MSPIQIFLIIFSLIMIGVIKIALDIFKDISKERSMSGKPKGYSLVVVVGCCLVFGLLILFVNSLQKRNSTFNLFLENNSTCVLVLEKVEDLANHYGNVIEISNECPLGRIGWEKIVPGIVPGKTWNRSEIKWEEEIIDGILEALDFDDINYFTVVLEEYYIDRVIYVETRLYSPPETIAFQFGMLILFGGVSFFTLFVGRQNLKKLLIGTVFPFFVFVTVMLIKVPVSSLGKYMSFANDIIIVKGIGVFLASLLFYFAPRVSKAEEMWKKVLFLLPPAFGMAFTYMGAEGWIGVTLINNIVLSDPNTSLVEFITIGIIADAIALSLVQFVIVFANLVSGEESLTVLRGNEA